MEVAQFRCGDFQVDLPNRCFLHAGREIALEPKVFAVIAHLLRRAGDLVPRNELLDSVWGHRYVTPSTLNRTIALARRAFGDDVAEPRFIQTVHGVGYRYVGPVETNEPPAGAVRARFAPPFAVRLPSRIEALIGREGELSALAELLARHRALTVLGAGGMGKTQCAYEAARRMAGAFPDGVWVFDLSSLEDADGWLRMLASAMAAPANSLAMILPQVCQLMEEREALLVLDNCDPIAPDLGAIVLQILRATHKVRVLATSQRPLNYAGEQLFRMPPLAMPAAGAIAALTPESIVNYAAVELLATRVRSLRQDFVIDAGNAAVLGHICLKLDGMPLALELAAARFALLSPEQVLERLGERFKFLESGAAGRDERHRNLRSLLEWSYALLSAEEQRLLNWAAVFVQTWSVEGFLALAAALGHSPETAVDLLSGLVSHSLVSVVTDVTPPRYRLLESVREYALLQLRQGGEEQLARLKHLEAVAHTVAIAQRDILDGMMRERVEQLVLDRGNIDAALETAAAAGRDHPKALEILGSLFLHAKAHGDFLNVLRWSRLVMSTESANRSPERGRALLTLGVAQVHFSLPMRWLPGALDESARIAQACGDWWTEAYARGFLALNEANLGRPEEAETHLRVLLTIAQRHPDDELVRGLVGLAQGWICLARKDAAAALECLMGVKDLGVDLHQQHFIDMYIALSNFFLDRHLDAARQWLASLKLAVAVSNIRGMAGSVEGCAYLACLAGDWSVAARLLAAAEVVRERTGMPIFNFWLPAQAAALGELQLRLSEREFAAATETGRSLRPEDAPNEALALLTRYTDPAGSAFAQTPAKRPAGS